MTLSELVAVEVMGWKHEPVRVLGSTETVMVYRDAPQWPKDGYHNATELVSRWSMPPAFDEDITDAWRVVENLRARKTDNGARWRVAVTGAGDKWTIDVEDWKARIDVSACNDDVCIAICLAALRACGVSEERIEKARRNT